MNKAKLFKTVSLLLAVATSAQAGTLVIKGSDTLGAKLVPQLAEAFKASHSDVNFKIAAEGSSTGIAALISKNADIGMSSRRAKQTEIAEASSKGVNMKPTIVAYDGIAVFVNKSNPVAKLTRKQVEQIFTGDVTDWSAVGGKPGPISIYTRNTASGTYADFADMAMKKRNYAKSAQKMAGSEQVAAEVSKNPNGIGYCGMAYIDIPGLKPVAVDGVAPTLKTVQSKQFPYSRPVFYYTNGDPTGSAKEFIDFTLGPAGQKIAVQVGFAPAR